MLSGEGSIPIKTSIIPKQEVPLVNKFADWIDFKQTRYKLVIIGVESGSSLSNSISFFFTLVSIICYHLIVISLPKCKPIHDKQKCRTKYQKIKIELASLFLLSIYIRTLYETFQFLLLISFSDIEHGRLQDGSPELASFIFSTILVVFCIGFIMWSVYSFYASDSLEKTGPRMSREFVAGLKETKKARMYSPISLLRRVLFCLWLIFMSNVGPQVSVGVLLVVQVPYLLFFLIVRPLDEPLANIVESIHELFFTIIVVYLLIHTAEHEWTKSVTNLFTSTLLIQNGLI